MDKLTKSDDLQWRESSVKALFPFIVFVLFYFGFSILTRDFSKVPMSVAFIISSAVALTLNHKEKLGKKIEIFALGMGNRDIMMMCLIFILAGAFTATAEAVGAVDAVVAIAQNIVPHRFMMSGMFIVSALISLSIGTSCGTIAAVVPIAVELSQALGLPAGVMLGAVVGGAMFGDSLSVISDTTIASTRTQNVEMRDKMIFNFKIVTIPSILCVLIYLLPVFAPASDTTSAISVTLSSYIKIAPYFFLLIFGMAGMNVMFLLFVAIILNLVIGIHYGSFDMFGGFAYIGDGTVSMANTIVVAMLAGGMLQMVRYNGGITYIIKATEHFIKNKKLCELGICFLVGMMDLFTANNTVAIITAGPIAKELSQKYGVDARRTASLLDTTSCCFQGVIPYGAQILIATSLSASIAVSSFTIMKTLFYPALVGMGIIVSIILGVKIKDKK